MDICRCLAESERRTMSGNTEAMYFHWIYLIYDAWLLWNSISKLTNLVEVIHYEDSDRRITH